VRELFSLFFLENASDLATDSLASDRRRRLLPRGPYRAGFSAKN
jgi:hypothetical protein